MKCRSCGSNIQSGAKQCPHCGADVPSASSYKKEEFQWNVDYFPQPRNKKDISVDWNAGTIVDGESDLRYRHSNIKDKSINNRKADLDTDAEYIGGNDPELREKRLIRSEIDDLNEFGWESDRKAENEVTGLDRIRRSVRGTDEFGWNRDSAVKQTSERSERKRRDSSDSEEFGWGGETESKKSVKEIQKKNNRRENSNYNELNRDKQQESRRTERYEDEGKPLRVDTGEFGWERAPESRRTERYENEGKPLRVDTDEFGWERAPESRRTERYEDESEPLRVDTDEFGWERAPEGRRTERYEDESKPLRVDTDEFGWEKVPESRRTERKADEKRSVKIDTGEFGWGAVLTGKNDYGNIVSDKAKSYEDVSEEFDWEMQQDERRDTIKFNSYLLERDTGSLSETRELKELLVFSKQNEDFQQVLDQQMDTISSEVPETDVISPRGFDLPSSMDMKVFDSLIEEGSVHTGDELIDQADALADSIPDTSSAVQNLHRAGIVGRETMVRLDSLIGSGDGYQEDITSAADDYRPAEKTNAPRTIHAEISDYPDNTFDDNIYDDEEPDITTSAQEYEYDDPYEESDYDYQEKIPRADNFEERQADIADTPDRAALFDEDDENELQYYYEESDYISASDGDSEGKKSEPEHEEYVFEKIQKLVDAEKKFKEDMERVSYLSPEEAEQIEQIENKREKLTFVPTISYSTLEDEYEAYKSGSETDKKKKRGVNIKINEPSGTKVTVKTQEINLANKSEESFDTREVRLENLKKPPKNVQVSVEVNSIMSNASVEVTRHHDGATVVKTIDNGSSHEEVFPENIIEEEDIIEEELIADGEVVDSELDDDDVEAHMVKDLTDDQAWDRPVSVPKMTITDIFGPGARKFINSKGHNKDEEDDDDDLTDSMILDIKPEDIAITREQTQSIRMPSGLSRRHEREEFLDEDDIGVSEIENEDGDIEEIDETGYAENYIEEYEPEILEAEEGYGKEEPENGFEDDSEEENEESAENEYMEVSRDIEDEYTDWDEESDDYEEDVRDETSEYDENSQDEEVVIGELESGERIYASKSLKYPKGWTGAPIMRIGKAEKPGGENLQEKTEKPKSRKREKIISREEPERDNERLRAERAERRTVRAEEPEYEEPVNSKNAKYEEAVYYEEADEYNEETGRDEYEYREIDAEEKIENGEAVKEYTRQDRESENREHEFGEAVQSEIAEKRERKRVILEEEPEYEEIENEKARFRKSRLEHRDAQSEEPEYEESPDNKNTKYEKSFYHDGSNGYYEEAGKDEYDYRKIDSDEKIENDRTVREYTQKDSEADLRGASQNVRPERRERERSIPEEEYEEAEREEARLRKRKSELGAVKNERTEFEEPVYGEKPKRKASVRDEESYEYRAGGLSEAPVMKRKRTEYEHTRAKIEKPEFNRDAKEESSEYSKTNRRKEIRSEEINHDEIPEYRKAVRDAETERSADVQERSAENRKISRSEAPVHQDRIIQQVYQPDKRVTGVIGKKPTIRLDRSPTIRLDDPENKAILHKKAKIIKIPQIAGEDEDIEYSGDNNDKHYENDASENKQETKKERRRARHNRDTEELENLSIDRRKVASAANGFQDITNIAGNPKKKKFGKVTKIIIAVLIVLIIAEFSIIGIRLLAPDSGAAVFIERVSEHIPFLNSESESSQQTLNTDYRDFSISGVIHQNRP